MNIVDNIPFVNIFGEEYGLVFDFNVISKIQNTYGTLSQWGVKAFGGSVATKVDDEDIKLQVLLLLGFIDWKGRVDKQYKNKAKEILDRLAAIYCLPVCYKEDNNEMIIENHLYLSDWYCGHKKPERKINQPKTKDLLRVFSFLVNEYVDIYNENSSNFKKAKLSESQLGRLQLGAVRKAVLQSIDISFDTVKSSKPATIEDPPIDIAEVYVFGMSKLGFSYKEIGRVTLKFFNELCKKYKKIVCEGT